MGGVGVRCWGVQQRACTPTCAVTSASSSAAHQPQLQRVGEGGGRGVRQLQEADAQAHQLQGAGGGGGCRDGAVWAAFRGSTCSTHVTLPPQLERAWELCSAAASARSARHTHQQHGCVGDARPLEAQAHDDAAAEGHEDEQGAVGGRHLARVLA
jgi:hypothetical protein